MELDTRRWSYLATWLATAELSCRIAARHNFVSLNLSKKGGKEQVKGSRNAASLAHLACRIGLVILPLIFAGSAYLSTKTGYIEALALGSMTSLAATAWGGELRQLLRRILTPPPLNLPAELILMLDWQTLIGLSSALVLSFFTPGESISDCFTRMFALGNLSSVTHPNPSSPSDWMVLPFFIILCLSTAVALASWSFLVANQHHGPVQELLEPIMTWTSLPIFGFYNALSEEIDFRVLLFSALMGSDLSLQSFVSAASLSSVLFAGFHYLGGFPYGIIGFLMVLVWSLALSLVTWMTSGFLLAYLAHVLADVVIGVLVILAKNRKDRKDL